MWFVGLWVVGGGCCWSFVTLQASGLSAVRHAAAPISFLLPQPRDYGRRDPAQRAASGRRRGLSNPRAPPVSSTKPSLLFCFRTPSARCFSLLRLLPSRPLFFLLSPFPHLLLARLNTSTTVIYRLCALCDPSSLHFLDQPQQLSEGHPIRLAASRESHHASRASLALSVLAWPNNSADALLSTLTPRIPSLCPRSALMSPPTAPSSIRTE